MPRSLWKGPFFNFSLMERVQRLIRVGGPAKQKQAIRTQCRSTTVMPEFIGFRFEIHNGNKYLPVEIKEGMVGYKLGDFALTRKRGVHPEKGAGSVLKKK